MSGIIIQTTALIFSSTNCYFRIPGKLQSMYVSWIGWSFRLREFISCFFLCSVAQKETNLSTCFCIGPSWSSERTESSSAVETPDSLFLSTQGGSFLQHLGQCLLEFDLELGPTTSQGPQWSNSVPKLYSKL